MKGCPQGRGKNGLGRGFSPHRRSLRSPLGFPWLGSAESPLRASVNGGPASGRRRPGTVETTTTARSSARSGPVVPTVPGLPRVERSLPPLCPQLGPACRGARPESEPVLPSSGAPPDRGCGPRKGRHAGSVLDTPCPLAGRWPWRTLGSVAGRSGDTRSRELGRPGRRASRVLVPSPPGPSGKPGMVSQQESGRRRGGGFSRLLFHTLGGCPVALLRHLTGLRAGSLVLTLPVTGPCARGAWTRSGHRKTASVGDSASVSELATHTCALLPETSPAVCGWQGACQAAP